MIFDTDTQFNIINGTVVAEVFSFLSSLPSFPFFFLTKKKNRMRWFCILGLSLATHSARFFISFHIFFFLFFSFLFFSFLFFSFLFFSFLFFSFLFFSFSFSLPFLRPFSHTSSLPPFSLPAELQFLCKSFDNV